MALKHQPEARKSSQQAVIIVMMLVAGFIGAQRFFGNDRFGDKLEMGAEEIYYDDGATELEARAFHQFLTEIQLFNGDEEHKSARVLHAPPEGDDFTIVLQVVVRDDVIDDDEIRDSVSLWAEMAAAGPFWGRSVRMELCDDRLEPVFHRTSTGRLGQRYDASAFEQIFYVGEDATEELATAIGSYLQTQEYFSGADPHKTLALTIPAQPSLASLCFVMQDAAFENVEVHLFIAAAVSEISSQLMHGRPLVGQICNQQIEVHTDGLGVPQPVE